MKNTILAFAVLFALASCSKDGDGDDENLTPNPTNIDYRQEMRNFVIGISEKAKGAHPGFAVIPQNGIELISQTGEAAAALNTDYLNAIDGHGQENLFYGYNFDYEPTPQATTDYIKSYLDRSKAEGKTILVTDYCNTPATMANSYSLNATNGYISYAAAKRDLDTIPQEAPHNENADNITQLSQAKNFLYLINPEHYPTKEAFITAVTATNYDVLIMDMFLNEESFTAAEVNLLRNKANGGKRMVICYMSIGEAENYRYYWQEEWNVSRPAWAPAENPDWPGNFVVRYWDAEWQGIIYKNEGSYLDRILQNNFDGVYLDIIDAFEYFEQ